ncbi:MAG: VWA domain-containing protein [Bryobacteraceae bacterium]|nr:VWA domain-containing protein [Bryobacterales bacterium]MEB2364078.1 VWA domain-containing protein [Bryobacterales bacterium]NUN02244.1 VWA domain-containing protein [Bryobacteraceae bacterium]
MQFRRRLPAAVVCFFALIAGSLCAGAEVGQKKGTAAPDDPNRIILDVTRVNILFTVADRKGRFVTDLVKDDFLVFEGKNRQDILEFTAESDLPLRLAILIDTSNSIRDRFRFEQEAAVEFIQSLLRPGQDKAVVVSFDTAAELVADLTDDQRRLENAIRELRPGGGTALYDAIFFACRDKLMLDQPRHKFRRAMVVLSDGDDNQSHYTRDQALEMAQKADVVIYTISTNITRIPSQGDKVLKYFAEETGGLTFFPFKVQDLSQSFENIANELRHQYNLLYRPEPLRADGQYHEVEVKVKDRKGLMVRARKGYYAPKL